MTPSQPIGGERSLRELHAAADRVLIADPDGFARRMLQRVLRDVGRVVVITAARDGREALQLARQYRPEVLLVDIALPPAGGVELIREVVPILPDARIVTISAAPDHDQAVLAALRAGAIGHIDKEIDPDHLARLVTLAADGEALVPRRLGMRLLAMWRQTASGGWRPRRSSLTRREWQVVELLGEGASTAGIAERLVLSPSTVYSHISSVLHKLGVHSRRDAVTAARRLHRA